MTDDEWDDIRDDLLGLSKRPASGPANDNAAETEPQPAAKPDPVIIHTTRPIPGAPKIILRPRNGF